MKKIFVVLTYILFSIQAISAQEIKVAFGSTKPPFVIDSTKGIEISLAQEAFKRSGYTIKKVLLSNKRMIEELTDKNIDVAISIPKNNNDFFYSQAFISFDNYVVVKKNKQLKVINFNDLKGMSLISWQNAPIDLNNTDFNTAIKEGIIKLTEQAKQDIQVKMFLLNRFDGIVIDKTIFRYVVNKLKTELDLKDEDIEFDYFKLFPGITSLYNGFNNKDLRDKFDKALSEMKSDGTYEKIIESYVN